MKLSFWFISLAAAAQVFAEEPFVFEKTPGRLPKDVIPRHYAVRIVPDIEGAKFAGSVDVDVEATKVVRSFVLNSKKLAIAKASVGDVALAVKVDDAAELLTLSAPGDLAAGKHRVHIEFSGVLGEAPEGIYLTRYQQPGGAWHKAVATQMEPTDARRMFPCWDEPVFRSTFQLTAVVPPKHTTLFNMPVVSERPLEQGMREVVFGTTPPMPSYLVAFVSSELEEMKGESEGVKLGLFATPGKRERLAFSMAVTKQVLPYMNEYFAVRYSLPKLDQVAFPSVGAGGMENWGCIIYADSALLFSEKENGFAARRGVFGIVAHEIAHQWFGDLVTMAWWDNLWLNEGFASWMASKASAEFNPSWKVWTTAAGAKEAAMRLDARATTHPIQQPVANETEAGAAFDEITYQKGQAFLRMLENWLGEDVFRDGMRLYFKRHALGNTTTANLWAALHEVSGKDVRAMAAGWTEQPGFPVIRVRANAAGDVTLTQERFTIHQKSPAPLTWSVPITMKSFPAGEPSVQLVEKAPLNLQKQTLPLVVNSGAAGYFRVQYEGEAWEQIKLNLTRLPELDQITIAQDTWALVLAGRVPLAQWLEVAELLRNEATPLVASELVRPLAFLDSLMRGSEKRGDFRGRAVKLLEPIARRIGWDAKPGEEPAAESLRVQLIETLGAWGVSSFRAEAQDRLTKYLANPEALNGPLRGAVLAVAGRFVSPEVWEQLHERAKAKIETDHKSELYRALITTRSEPIIKKALTLVLSGELPSRQSTRLLRDIASGEFPELAWTFAQKNLGAILEKLTANDANRYVPSLFHAFTEEARAVELEEFVKANLPPTAMKAAAIAAEDVRFRAESKERLLPQLATWMK